MTFSQVIQDIKKMIGLELCSIRPGSNITILEVDEDRNNLILITSQGTKRSRPLSELKLIWDEMLLHPAVHVDEVLHGSGTSRNQPETILANLPYVEWLKITNKKHIAYVIQNTHAYGTIKQMDSMSSAKLIEKAQNIEPDDFSMVVVSNQIHDDLILLNSVLVGKEVAIEQGIYRIKSNTGNVLIVSDKKSELSPGSYCILNGNNSIKTLQRTVLLNKVYFVLCTEKLKILFKDE